MKKTITTILLSCFLTTAFAQEWNPNGNNSMKGSLSVGELAGKLIFPGNDNYSTGRSIIQAHYSANSQSSLQFLSQPNRGVSGSTPLVRMHINHNGNVGIGTTNPSYLLDVNGELHGKTVRGDIVKVGSSTSDSSALIIESKNSAGKLIFPGNDNYSTGRSIIQAHYSANSQSSLQFLSQPNRGVSGSTPLVRMHINHNGNVGIGTTNPSYLLDVNGELHGKTVRGDIVKVGSSTSDSSALIIESKNSAGKLIFPGNDNYSTGRSIIQAHYSANSQSSLQFLSQPNRGVSGSTPLVRMHINHNGNVGIGTTNPSCLLDVAGTIRAHEVIVEVPKGADFVFEQGYNLKPLSEVESFIQANKHLPEVQSEKEMQANGLSVNEFQIKLLQKIEELTLYIIQQDKRIADLESKKK